MRDNSLKIQKELLYFLLLVGFLVLCILFDLGIVPVVCLILWGVLLCIYVGFVNRKEKAKIVLRTALPIIIVLAFILLDFGRNSFVSHSAQNPSTTILLSKTDGIDATNIVFDEKLSAQALSKSVKSYESFQTRSQDGETKFVVVDTREDTYVLTMFSKIKMCFLRQNQKNSGSKHMQSLNEEFEKRFDDFYLLSSKKALFRNGKTLYSIECSGKDELVLLLKQYAIQRQHEKSA